MDTNRTAKLEFAVQMSCDSCVNAVKGVLERDPGVQSVHVDLAKEQVLVETALTSLQVQSLIESTGRRAVLKGMGGSETGETSDAVKMLFIINFYLFHILKLIYLCSFASNFIY
uniref:Protein kinase D4 n=1 Tax=Cyprinus carpio TaxID=7962 RepID=A0A8C2E9H3_CYPCA